MGRFISNFRLYSERKPERFILVILPGDEQRNFRSLSGTPYWENQPKFPEATNNAINKNENLPKELQYVLDAKENFHIFKNTYCTPI